MNARSLHAAAAVRAAFPSYRSSVLMTLGTACLSTLPLRAQTVVAPPAAIRINPDSSLSYTPTSKGDVVPDFSYAGYAAGLKTVPGNPGGVLVPTVIVLEPQSGDQTGRIQAAIDTVSKLPVNGDGFRGAVLLKSGVWEVATGLRISASGVVLRGESNHPLTGTHLRATEVTTDGLTGNTKKSSFIAAIGSGLSKDNSRARAVLDAYVPVGAMSFRVDQVGTFKVGGLVSVERPKTQDWINSIGMAPNGWTPSASFIKWTRKITAIDGDRITLDAPITTALDVTYGGGIVIPVTSDRRISNVGVENLYISSQFAAPNDENHKWNAIEFNNLVDGFVQDVVTRYFAYTLCYVDSGAQRVTIQRSQFLDPVSLGGVDGNMHTGVPAQGGRRYSFLLNGEQGLVRNCVARFGRHDFVQSWPGIAGPNAFVDCLSKNPYNESGSHLGWASGALWDNVNTWKLEVKNHVGSHGWEGANDVFWNTTVSGGMIFSVPPTANNWAFGCKVGSFSGNATLVNQATGKVPANPMPVRSLYDAQLAARYRALGKSYTAPAPAIPSIVPVLAKVTNAERTVAAGNPFSFQIEGTTLPRSYDANGLPAGLTVNKTTGVISGTPTLAVGSTGALANITLIVSNGDGPAYGTLKLAITAPSPVVK
ncbi:MAG: putative Ig domain-containing protein [Verrucomicrobiota bacterium]